MKLNGLSEMKEAVMAAKNEAEERQALAACLDANGQKYEWMADGRLHSKVKNGSEAEGILRLYIDTKKDKTAKAKAQAEALAEKNRRASLTEAEREAEDVAKEILCLGKAKNGAPFVKVQSCYKVGETILFDGVIFKITGVGKIYNSYGHDAKNIYIDRSGWTFTNKAEYKIWKEHAKNEFENSRESFGRMMEDESCVCCTPECKLWSEIAKALQSDFEMAERKIKVYLSSKGWGDYGSVYWEGSNKTAQEQYLTEAREILAREYDVDHRNQTNDELMAAFEKANKEQGR